MILNKKLSTLSDNQLKRIKVIHSALSEVYNISLEQSIKNFMKDMNPESEIEIWEAIAEAYREYCCSKLLNNHDKKMAFQIFLLRSMGSENYVIEQIAKSGMTPNTIRKILSYYKGIEKPIIVQDIKSHI